MCGFGSEHGSNMLTFPSCNHNGMSICVTIRTFLENRRIILKFAMMFVTSTFFLPLNMCVCVHVCLCACVFVCMCVCVHVCLLYLL